VVGRAGHPSTTGRGGDGNPTVEGNRYSALSIKVGVPKASSAQKGKGKKNSTPLRKGNVNTQKRIRQNGGRGETSGSSKRLSDLNKNVLGRR